MSRLSLKRGKKAQCVSHGCKDLFERKKYFGVRCTLMSSESSGVLTEKLRVVAKVYKMAAKDEIKEAVYALNPLRGKMENLF